MNRRLQLYFLSIFSGFIYAVVVTLDAIILSIVQEDAVTAGLSFFLVGVAINPIIMGLAVLKIRGRTLGEFFDPSFRGLIIPQGEKLRYLLLAGLANAGGSLLYFAMLKIYRDPSAMLTFTSLVSVYLLGLDILVERERPSAVEIQGIVAISVGSLLVSFTLGEVDLFGLLLVLGAMNLFLSLQTLALKKAGGSRFYGDVLDGINARFWLLNFTTIFVIAVSALAYGLECVKGALLLSVNFFSLLALDMGLTFASYALYIRALGLGKMSEVNALYSTSIVFALVIHLAISPLIPALRVELAGIFLALKSIGVLLTALGVATLALTEVTAYVFIKAKPGAKNLLEKLMNVGGVETVSATAGPYDFILRVRIRSLGQAYHIITKELGNIEGVADFVWLTTLREWQVS